MNCFKDGSLTLGIRSMNEMDTMIARDHHLFEVSDIAYLESFQFQRGLDPHGHDHVAVILVPCGLNQTRLGLVLEVELDFLVIHDFEAVQHVLGVEADLERLTLVIQIDLITGFTHIGV